VYAIDRHSQLNKRLNWDHAREVDLEQAPIEGSLPLPLPLALSPPATTGRDLPLPLSPPGTPPHRTPSSTSGSGKFDLSFLETPMPKPHTSEPIISSDMPVSWVPVGGTLAPLQIGKEIARGGFSAVYRATLGGRLVAAKVAYHALGTESSEVCIKERAIHEQLHHPQLVTYLGSFELKGTLVLLLEYMGGGTLHDFLGLTPAKSQTKRDECQLKQLLLDTATGLAWLHEQGLLHRDVKGSNVLLDERYERAKLGDLGIATLHHSFTNQTPVQGTLRYSCPDLVKVRHLPAVNPCWTEACDVYAFGLLLYEATYLMRAFDEYENGMAALMAAAEGERPIRNQNLPRNLGELGQCTVELMQLCWHQNPQQRLPMREVVKRLASTPTNE